MDLTPLRNVLYDILTVEEDGSTGEVNATQKMGVELTNAVKKDGVNIIQIQSVVSTKVVKKVTDALRFLDAAQKQIDSQCHYVEVREVEEVKALPAPTPEFVVACAARRAPLREFLEVAEKEYIAEFVVRYGEADALRILGIRKSRMEAALTYMESQP